MSTQIQETHINSQNDEHYKIVVIGAGLVRFNVFVFE